MAQYFGFAKDIITPWFKTTVACSGTFGVPFTEVHDDVYVRAAVMDDGENKLILIAYDLLFHSPELNIKMEQYIWENYGIQKDYVVVSYTHSHLSPSCAGYDHGNTNAAYEEYLLQRSRNCIDRAFCSMFEGVLEHGETSGKWSINRRLKTKEGIILAPNHEGETDDSLHVLKVKDVTGTIRGMIVNYACHPVHYPHQTNISAEYPGRICQLIDAEYYGCISLFLQGAAAEVRPYLTEKEGEFVSCSYEEVDKMAKSITNKIDGSKDLSSEVHLKLAAKQFSVDLDIDPKPLEYFEELSEDKDQLLFYRQNAKIIIENYDKIPDYCTIRLGLVRMSENLWLGSVSGEPCIEIKRLVQEAIGGGKLIFSGYSDAAAYVVSDHILEEGGYEAECFAEYCLKGKFKKGVDKKIGSAFKKFALEMKR